MALPELLMRPRPRVLVADVGGTHVKVLATGHRTPREIRSGPTMTAREMIAAVERLVALGGEPLQPP
jgi:hypothetical protein